MPRGAGRSAFLASELSVGRAVMARIGVQIGLALVMVLAGLAGGVLLVAAAIAALVPVTGLPGALGIAGLGFFGLALTIALVLRARARAAARRRQAAAWLTMLVDLVLLLMPNKNRQRLEAWAAAGVGIAALIALLLTPEKDPDT